MFNKKFSYEFCTGEKCEVEITDPVIIEAIEELDREEKNNKHKHKRPHKYTGYPVSLDELYENSFEHASPIRLENLVITRVDLERALEVLTPEERKLIYSCGAMGVSIREYAKRIGITEDAAYKRYERIKKKIAPKLANYQ